MKEFFRIVLFGMLSVSCGCITSKSPDCTVDTNALGDKKSIGFTFRVTATSSNAKEFNPYIATHIGTGAWVNPQSESEALAQFNAVFSPVVKEVKRFYTTVDEDYDIKLALNQQSTFDMAGAVLGGFVCGATLMFVPCWGDDVYYLHAIASSCDGLKKEYLIRRSVTTSAWLPFILAMPFVELPWTARNHITMENWKELRARMEADGFFGTQDPNVIAVKDIGCDSAAESNRIARIRKQGVGLRDFYNIEFYQNVSKHMKDLGILPIDAKMKGIREYQLGLEFERVHKDYPGSKCFLGFRPHTFYVKDDDTLVGIVASSGRIIVGRDKMSEKADLIIREINRIIAFDGEPRHVGNERLHYWSWMVKDDSGKDVRIVLTANSDANRLDDRWIFGLTLFSLVSGAIDPLPEDDARQDTAVSTGTGWFVADDKIITCQHVVDGAKTIRIECADGRECDAFVIASSKEKDIAILAVKDYKSNICLPIQPRVQKISTKVFTIGYPIPGLLGSEQKYTDGTISALSGIGGDKTYYQISVPIQPGNSGGALVNEDGQVVGITSSLLNAIKTALITGSVPQNVCYAVKSRYIVELLEDASVPFSTEMQAGEHTQVVERVGKATALIKVSGN